MDIVAENLKALRERLALMMAAAAALVLLWSGGMDSTLLLFLAREIKEIPVIQFRDRLTGKQLLYSDRLFRELKLKIITYAPFDRYFIPADDEGGGGLTLVDEYRVGAGRIPVLRDLVHADDLCALDAGNDARTEEFVFPFDLALTGWRIDDGHGALDGIRVPDKMIVGHALFFSPLYAFSRDEVREMSLRAGVPEDENYGDAFFDTGNFAACARCLEGAGRVFCPKKQKEISGFKWNKNEALRAFRARFE